ncbi:MAG: glycosyltransferase, partial [Pseudomonadota bacterium]
MTGQARPLFGIIIAARNADRFILDTLRSLTFLPNDLFRVIVVNDGSTDGTADVVETFKDAHPEIDLTLLDGPARGVSAARNKGLSQTNTPYVIFLDADDLLAADALDSFRAALTDVASVAALGRVLRITEDGNPMPSPDNRDLLPESDQLYALIRKNFIVNGGALAIRTEVAKAVEGYDETLKYGEDWEFWCRVLTQGKLTALQNDYALKYRQISTGANVTAASKPFARDILCLKRVRKNPVIRQQVGWRLLVALRMRRVDIFWSGVRTTYQYGQKRAALLLSAVGLLVYPDSIMRPRLALRLLK